MFKVVVCSFCLLLGLVVGNASALEITVSPSVLVVNAPGDAVSIHTNMPGAVVGSCGLSVNGTSIDFGTFTDNCGNIVVRCSRKVVVGVLGDDAETATFCLTVETVAGTTESGTDTVSVKR
ncbi:MAG: hypothetical protein JW888_14415 [Pirellulales bacterium]|nr:hypothetical protein [Pirellulales bacterium]